MRSARDLAGARICFFFFFFFFLRNRLFCVPPLRGFLISEGNLSLSLGSNSIEPRVESSYRPRDTKRYQTKSPIWNFFSLSLLCSRAYRIFSTVLFISFPFFFAVRLHLRHVQFSIRHRESFVYLFVDLHACCTVLFISDDI